MNPQHLIEQLINASNNGMMEFYMGLQDSVNHILTKTTIEMSRPDKGLVTLHSVDFKSKHHLVLNCSDEDGLRVTIDSFFNGPWHDCSCADDEDREYPLTIDISEELHETIVTCAVAIKEITIETSLELIEGLSGAIDEADSESRGRNLEMGALYHFRNNELDLMVGKLLKVTRVRFCHESGVKLVSGFVIDEDGFHMATNIPFFCVAEKYESVRDEDTEWEEEEDDFEWEEEEEEVPSIFPRLR